MTSDGTDRVIVRKLTAASFAEFGDVIELGDRPVLINDGKCERHSDLARLDFDPSGRGGISLFDSRIRTLPYEFRLMERHPLGSQAFLPLGCETLLVIAAPDLGDAPGMPLAFESSPFQGVNFRRGVWHGVLTPLSGRGLFAVFDWIGDAENLQTYQFSRSFRVVRQDSVGGSEDP